MEVTEGEQTVRGLGRLTLDEVLFVTVQAPGEGGGGRGRASRAGVDSEKVGFRPDASACFYYRALYFWIPI